MKAHSNPDLEKNTLSVLIEYPERLNECALTPEHFIRYEHRQLFLLLQRMHRNDEEIDSVTVPQRTRDNPNQYGSVTDVSAIIDAATPAAAFDQYVKDLENIRQIEMYKALAWKIKEAADNAIDPIDQIPLLVERINHISDSRKPLFELDSMPANWLDITTRPPKREYLLSRPDDPADPKEWIGWLPRSKIAMLAAAGGTGKTMALVQLALCVATGHKWFGYQPQSRDRRRILLALGEEDRDEVWRRLHFAAEGLGLNHHDKEQARKRIVPLPLAGVSGVGLTDREGKPTDALRSLQRRLNAAGEWELLILDPASRFMGPGTESDNTLATRFVSALESLVDVPGRPTVLVAHHTSQTALQAGSTDQTASRGVTGLVDGFRWQAVMAWEKGTIGKGSNARWEVENLLRLKLAKTNYSAKGPAVHLEYAERGVLKLVEETEAKERIAKAKEPATKKSTAKKNARELTSP